MLPSGTPELLHDFGLTPAAAAGLTLFALLALSSFVETPLLAMAQGDRGRRMLVAGLAVLGLGSIVAAASPSFPVLLGVLFALAPVSGVGVSLAQAAAVAERPGQEDRVLARWTLWGAIGDLAAPLVLAASVAVGASWRGALLLAGAVAIAQALAARRAHVAGVEVESVRASLRDALRNRALIGWSLATTACSLMDEVLVAFGALHLDAALGAEPWQRAVVIGAWTIGGMAGAAALEALASKARAPALLAVSAAGSAVTYVAWLGATSWTTSAALLACFGIFSAAHYPLLVARAYAAVPGRPELAAAMASMFNPVEAVIPLAVGLIADEWGVAVALWALLAQPAVVGLAAAVVSKSHRAIDRRTR